MWMFVRVVYVYYYCISLFRKIFDGKDIFSIDKSWFNSGRSEWILRYIIVSCARFILRKNLSPPLSRSTFHCINVKGKGKMRNLRPEPTLFPSQRYPLDFSVLFLSLVYNGIISVYIRILPPFYNTFNFRLII